jgi:glutathione peroxidase
MKAALYDIPLKRIDGTPDRLGEHAGKVLLIVNVASKCGLTPQYTGLDALFQSKRAQGLEVLGFPANNFLGQEPGSEAEIRTFCSTQYDVHFPLFSKISVVGADQHPLYAHLTGAKPAATGDGPFRERLKGFNVTPNDPPDVLWNFEKFLVSRTGEVIARFAPDVTADDPRLLAAIDKELARAGK